MKKINPMLSKILAGFIVIVALSVITGLCSTAFAETVDKDPVILANGNILTMNPEQPTASAMAVKDGKIITVGDLASVKKRVGKSYEYIDFEGKTVVPGFIETHEHPSGSLIEKFTQFFPGSKAVRKAVDEFRPNILLCSHVHEAQGIEEVINDRNDW